MSTTTTDRQLKTIANRLQSYTTADSVSVKTHNAKVYLWFAAPDAALPNIVLTKLAATSDPDFHHLRETFAVECRIQGRARKDEPTVNGIADVVQSAFQMWSDSTSGLMLYLGLRREDVQYTTDQQDQELIELRLAIEFAAWPVLSTALT